MRVSAALTKEPFGKSVRSTMGSVGDGRQARRAVGRYAILKLEDSRERDIPVSALSSYGGTMRRCVVTLLVISLFAATAARAAGPPTVPKNAPAGADQIETHRTQAIIRVPHPRDTDRY